MNIRRSVKISFVSKYLELGTGFATSVILARLLTPEDFGIYSIAASIVTLGYLFRNFGVGQLIVSAEKLDDELLRSAFALTLLISWSIGALLAIAAHPLAQYYDNVGVAQVLYLMALNFFLLPFGAIPEAILRREMAFDRLAVINVSAAIASMVVGISTAYYGYRYLSIAFAGNASTATMILLTLLLRPRKTPWLPSMRGMRKILAFGLKVGSIDVVSRVTDASTELLVGRFYGLALLGIYSRAFGAFTLFEYAFSQALRPVILPYLAKARRDAENVGDLFLRITSLTTAFLGPFFLFLLFFSEDVIFVLYGDQWGRSASILVVMAISGFFFAPTIFFEQLLVASRHEGKAVAFQVTTQTLRLLSLILLVTHSLEFAAASLIVANVGRLLIASRFLHSLYGISWKRYLSAMQKTAIVTVVLALSLGLAINTTFYETSSHLVRMLILGISTLTIWAAALFTTRHPLAQEIRALF